MRHLRITVRRRRLFGDDGDSAGVALIEFAATAPLLLLAVLGSIELTNQFLVRQRVSAAAVQIADNAGRLGDRSLSGPQRITEKQINDVLLGGVLQADKLDLQKSGRIILSSLETNKDGGQWIHWQRCRGDLATTSSYGKEGDGKAGATLKGMGPVNGIISAGDNRPVMFVEIIYKVAPVAWPSFVPSSPISERAGMPVRGDRDLSDLANGERAKVSAC